MNVNFFFQEICLKERSLVFKMATGSKTAIYWNSQSVSDLPWTLKKGLTN